MDKKLQRNEQDKIIAGVCSGLADYFDVDVTWIRVAFVVAVMAGFSGILAYIILWIAVPSRPFMPNAHYPGNSRYTADYRVYEEKPLSSSSDLYAVPDPSQTVSKKNRNGNGRMIAGLLLVGFGAYFLLDEFNIIPYWFDFDKLWPLIFIIPGLLIISKNSKRRTLPENEKIHTEDTKTESPSDTILPEQEPRI